MSFERLFSLLSLLFFSFFSSSLSKCEKKTKMWKEKHLKIQLSVRTMHNTLFSHVGQKSLMPWFVMVDLQSQHLCIKCSGVSSKLQRARVSKGFKCVLPVQWGGWTLNVFDQNAQIKSLESTINPVQAGSRQRPCTCCEEATRIVFGWSDANQYAIAITGNKTARHGAQLHREANPGLNTGINSPPTTCRWVCNYEIG